MTWIASQVAMRRPELKSKFLPIAEHGLQYLNDTLWDKQNGGFYWGLDDEKFRGFYQDGTTFGKPESRLKEWWLRRKA